MAVLAGILTLLLEQILESNYATATRCVVVVGLQGRDAMAVKYCGNIGPRSPATNAASRTRFYVIATLIDKRRYRPIDRREGRSVCNTHDDVLS